MNQQALTGIVLNLYLYIVFQINETTFRHLLNLSLHFYHEQREDYTSVQKSYGHAASLAHLSKYFNNAG